ncbi:MAG: glycosyltransferase family 2 protein [Saprospiraceae bacterium]|nr:glycosyltransferase family 2 protein [Saprospiraceae bacterium]
MFLNKKIVVVLPAYNAAKTLERTIHEIPFDLVDELILCDDASRDETFNLAKKLAIHHVIRHEKNTGYGGNQKTLYNKAIEIKADIIIMLHPDYQYTPKLIPSMINLIANDLYPVVLGSRILGKGALKGGMPYYKYIFNRLLTLTQNALTGYKLSEYHTGYRAFDAKVLNAINYKNNSDDFVFDNQILSQIIYKKFHIGEISCPTNYFDEASSINFSRSVCYGMGVLITSLKHFLQRTGIAAFEMYR